MTTATATEPTAAEIRAWAREQGIEVAVRGKLPPEVIADYASAHPHPGQGTLDGQYEGGVTAADFPPDPDEPGADESAYSDRDRLADEAAAAASGGGGRPRTVKAPGRLGQLRDRARSAGSGTGPAKGKAKRKPAGRPRSRRSTEKLMGRGWGLLARCIQPVSMPTGRMLAMQAPVAGMLLDDAVAGTLVDRILQPVAGAQEKAEAIAALVVPPLAVMAVHMNPGMAQMIMPILRESLALYIELAGPKIEQAKREAEEFEAKYGAGVDQILMILFAGSGIPGLDINLEPEKGTPQHAAWQARQEAAAQAQAEADRAAGAQVIPGQLVPFRPAVNPNGQG